MPDNGGTCKKSRAFPAGGSHALWVILGLLPITFCAGCRFVQTAAEIPGKAVHVVTPQTKKEAQFDPVDVQRELLRFADGFTTRMVIGVNKLHSETNGISAADERRWKIALSSETLSIASGPNAIANLLDMTVFVSLTRMAVEQHWRPEIFGDLANPLLESCRRAEGEIWTLAATVLKPEQQAELRRAIDWWGQHNPVPENVLAGRAVGFAEELTKPSTTGESQSGTVFQLLQLDPLASLDPATRELAQTRLFAERALYVAQKIPLLLRWQTELLTLNMLEDPTVQQLKTNSGQASAAVERVASVAEKLPGQVSAEREELLKALNDQENKLTPLINEVRQTLDTGSQMATSLNTTLTTLDAVMKRAGIGVTKTNANPFLIQDYYATAAQLEVAARQLTELLVTLDQTLGSTNLLQLTAQVEPMVERAQSSGREVVNHAFWRGVILICIVFVAALVYRFVTIRLARLGPTAP